MIDDWQYNNEEEAEMGQLHAIHLSLNAVAKIQSKLPKGPSATECDECGEGIPLQRQLAIQGVRLCIECKTAQERKLF